MSNSYKSTDCSPPDSSVHAIFPGKNTGVGCHFLLQGIFPSQRSNTGLLHCRRILYRLSHQGSLWRFLRKVKIELPCNPAIPFLDMYLEKTLIQKDTCPSVYVAVLFTAAKTWKQPKHPSVDEWIQRCGTCTLWNANQP